MKFAITSQNKRTVSGHAGKCSRFYVYDVNNKKEIISKELLELEPEMMLHFHFHGPNPEAHHPLFDMDVIITGDMGGGFPNKMRSKGVQAILTDVTDPDQVMEKALNGTLEMLPLGSGSCNH